MERRLAVRESAANASGSGGRPDPAARVSAPAAGSKSDDAPPPPESEPPPDPDTDAGALAESSTSSATGLIDDEPTGPIPAVEKTFLGILLHSEAHGESLLEHFGPDAFRHPIARRIVSAASGLLADGRPPEASVLLDALATDSAATELLGMLSVAESFAMEIDRQAEDCRSRMERRSLEGEMDRIMTEMRKAKARGEGKVVLDCASRRSDIAKQIAALNAPRETF